MRVSTKESYWQDTPKRMLLSYDKGDLWSEKNLFGW